jgi:hypothetical protein
LHIVPTRSLDQPNTNVIKKKNTPNHRKKSYSRCFQNHEFVSVLLSVIPHASVEDGGGGGDDDGNGTAAVGDAIHFGI